MSEAESRLNSTELRVLRRINTPTIANAIELFNVRPRHTGFLPHYIRCLLPELGRDHRLRRDLQDPRGAAGAR